MRSKKQRRVRPITGFLFEIGITLAAAAFLGVPILSSPETCKKLGISGLVESVQVAVFGPKKISEAEYIANQSANPSQRQPRSMTRQAINIPTPEEEFVTAPALLY